MEELIRVWQELWLDIFIFEYWDCCLFSQSKLDDWSSTATSTVTGNLKTWVSSRPSVQTLATLYSKVNYDSKPRESKGLMNFCPHILPHMMNHLIERRNLESRLSQNSVHPMPPDCWVFSWTFWPPSLCCSTSLQIWYLDFCSWWFLLKKTPFQWTAVT